MAETPKFNLRNPAVKRIMQEMKEIKQDTSGDILAEALETDIFEWHFVIRGPQDTEFEGGIYHGRILLPAEYPFKPPSFMMLTPNGRFETNVKICLSISSHHPEHWQPSWSVRTALMALIAFMPSPGGGALGALDFPKDERRLLANRSRMEPPRFGSAERQRVIDDMHGRMLAVAIAKETVTVQDPTVVAREAECQESPSGPVTGAEVGTAARRQQQPENPGMTAPAGGAVVEGDGGLVRMGMAPKDKAGRTAADCCAAACVTAAAASGDVRAGGDKGADEATSSATTACGRMGPDVPAPAVGHASTSSAPVSAVLSYQPMAACSAPSASPAHVAAFAATSHGARASPAHLNVATGATNSGSSESMGGGRVGATSTDHMLTALMWALYVGIGAILLRKVMGAMGVDITEMLMK